MQMKFNFNNFVFYGVSATAWQRASGIRRRRWRLWLAYPIMTAFRYVPYVPYVSSVTFPTLRALRWMETSLSWTFRIQLSRFPFRLVSCSVHTQNFAMRVQPFLPVIIIPPLHSLSSRPQRLPNARNCIFKFLTLALLHIWQYKIHANIYSQKNNKLNK